MRDAIAIVPARGGSKSIFKKNIAPLRGRPLISYSLKAIRKAKSIGRCIVSTDDPEIANIAQQFGAEVPFLRPPELAQDTTPTLSVIEHALTWLDEHQTLRPLYVLVVQPTSPFVKTFQIDELFELIVRKQADSGITVVEVPRVFHPYHVRHFDADDYLMFDNEELHYRHPRRQDDPKRYAFGNLYWFSRNAFLREKRIEVGKCVGLPIDALSAFDINDQFDLEVAQYLAEKFHTMI